MNTMAALHTRKNLARGKRVYTSSSRDTTSTGAKAVDAQTTTSWTTNANVSQWLQVDLGQRSTVSRVRLRWNAAFAPSYQIQTSLDAKAWKDVFATSMANGGVDDLVGLQANGRYLRIVMRQRAPRATHYSLQELEVFP
jgi:hypothetical protein